MVGAKKKSNKKNMGGINVTDAVCTGGSIVYHSRRN